PHEQNTDVVVGSLPVNMGGATQPVAKVIQLFRLRRIKISAGGKAVGKKVVAQAPGAAAKLSTQIVIVFSGAIVFERSVVAHFKAGAGSNIENTAKTVAKLSGESSGQQVNRFENLRRHTGRKLGLFVVEKRNAIDKFVQRKFIAAHIDKVIVALRGSRHQ